MDKRHTEEDKYIVNKFNEYKEFIKDKQISFVIRKSERIVYGVYMLSRFVPHDDVLAKDLKKTSHTLLQTVSQFVFTTGISSLTIDTAHATLQYLSSLLSLGCISGYISPSNIEIMKNEINYLHKHIEELSTRSATESGLLQFKSDMFVVSTPKPTHTRPVDNSKENISTKNKSVERTPVEHKSTEHKIKMSFIKDIKDKPVSLGPVNVDRESRVIDVIRDKGIVSIKDISTVIFDVSEKTIQRTLNTLIDKGQIKKEGERRWAKYQLV
jgi:hypothetical protein